MNRSWRGGVRLGLVAGIVLGAGAAAGSGLGLGGGRGTAEWDYASLTFVDDQTSNSVGQWRFSSPSENFGPAGLEDFSRMVGRAKAASAVEADLVNTIANRGWELVTQSADSTPRRMNVGILNGSSTAPSQDIQSLVTRQWWFKRARAK